MDGNECWALLLAAGQGSRLANATGGTAKQFLRWRGAPLWWASALALAASPRVSGLVFVFPPHALDQALGELGELDKSHGLGVPWSAVAGGNLRQDSVRQGLNALPDKCGLVLVHDSARPFLSTALTTRMADALMEAVAANPAEQSAPFSFAPLLQPSLATGDAMACGVSGVQSPAPPGPAGPVRGVVPGLTVTDTIKEVTPDPDHASAAEGGLRIHHTPDRAWLRAVQTPQAFLTGPLRAAHARALAEGWQVTDDAALMERCGYTVLVVEGDPDNVKITSPRDLNMLQEQTRLLPCAGYGYDVHRYGGNRPLVLGGVPIPGSFTVAAHSDGDVLLHALMDAILGCMGGGDIGRLFPDGDPRLEGISSALLLDQVLDMAAGAGLVLSHADLTVVAQAPRLAPHADAIRRNVARQLGLDEKHVNFKATTEEGLGFTGEERGLKAVALVSALTPAPTPSRC